ncbi:MAG TPA: hypothetical protein VK403_09375, partial [Allosphingosinicella sp.]|nr:hypothetical protein [Allosphingosinicella sp.]
MPKASLTAALLAASFATPAIAAPGTDEIAAELAAMRAKIAALEAEVAELKAARGAPAAGQAAPTATPTAMAEAKGGVGATFKPFGRLQYDVGHVESPRGVTD